MYSTKAPGLVRSQREQISSVIRSGKELITIENASTALHLDRVAAAKVLSRWAQQGWLKRVRRGLYAPVPLAASTPDQVLEDAWVLVPEIFSPGYVGGVSAAQHWDLTEQLFRTVFVYTTRPVRRTQESIQGIDFSVRHIDKRLLFGLRPLWRGRVKIQVADVHRTIIDMLDDPSTGGGARHVMGCLAAYWQRQDADPDRLVSYGEKLANGAVFKRLGFLAERSGGSATLVNACIERLTKGNAKLDPSLESPRLVTRWRLWVPTRWKDSPR